MQRTVVCRGVRHLEQQQRILLLLLLLPNFFSLCHVLAFPKQSNFLPSTFQMGLLKSWLRHIHHTPENLLLAAQDCLFWFVVSTCLVLREKRMRSKDSNVPNDIIDIPTSLLAILFCRKHCQSFACKIVKLRLFPVIFKHCDLYCYFVLQLLVVSQSSLCKKRIFDRINQQMKIEWQFDLNVFFSSATFLN